MMFPRTLVMSLFTLAFVPAFLTTSAGCDDAAPGDDDDDDDDDDDRGEGEGEGGEGEGEGEGEFPVTPDARALCEIATRGQLNFVGAIAQGVSQGFTTRCSADDEGPAFPEPAEIAAAAAQLCADDAFEVNQEFAKAIAGGRVSFDITNIEACSALDLEALEASGAVEIPAPCDPATLFVGLQTEGEPCDGEWECVGALRCEAIDIHAQALTCLAPAVAGEACVEGNITSDFGGLFENGQLSPRSCDENSRCVEFQCQARAGVGAECDASDDCVDGLTCDFGTDPPSCAALGDVGDPCTFDSDCLEDLGCTLAGQCETPAADGATCSAGDPCEENCSTCRPTTPGGATLQCQDRGVAGDSCASDDDCRHNFVCNAVTDACVPGGTAGAACFSDDECANGFACANDDTCIERPGLGEACGADTTESCTGALVCGAGACRAGVSGDPCDDDDDCNADGQACVDDGAAAACGAQPIAGEACSVDGDCADGLLCDETTCLAPPAIGADCTPTTSQCAANAFCDGGTCVGKKAAGAACVEDDECNAVCVNGQCTAEGASCTTSKGVFPLIVLLSSVLPLGRRWRRIRA